MTDRDLARLHWPRHLRPAFDALFAIDDAMGAVVASATQPALAAIKLAWWREQLEALDTGAPPAEPRLQAAAAELLNRGITGRELGRLEAGWAALLEEPPDLTLALGRGALLFDLAARLLGAEDARLAGAGRIYALADLRRRGHAVQQIHTADSLGQVAAPLRPLTALSALARRDLQRQAPEPEATPGRSWTLLRHRLTGRL
jgi:phytoene synthase